MERVKVVQRDARRCFLTLCVNRDKLRFVFVVGCSRATRNLAVCEKHVAVAGLRPPLRLCRCPADLTDLLDASAAVVPPRRRAVRRAGRKLRHLFGVGSVANGIKMLNTIASAKLGVFLGRPCVSTGLSTADRLRRRASYDHDQDSAPNDRSVSCLQL